MEYLIEILISLILPIFIVFNPLKEFIKNNKKKDWKKILKDYKYEFITYLIIFIGSLARLLALSIFPHGLNPDETSSGYEAWSILNYGIDRNLKSYPVFLISWGSGQNALYTYILIPFIKIFGLTEFATRLPMAIISSLSLLIIYYMFKELSNKKIAMLATFFLAICPWHIMKSRYGLESNIFPDLVLLSTTLIIFYVRKEKTGYIYAAFAILGLSAYSYGTSYFFLPFYVIPLLIYLIINKRITIKKAMIALIILIIIAMPIIIMVTINTFNLPEIKLFKTFTIPRLVSNRYESETSIFSNNFIKNSVRNFIQGMKIVLMQTDNSNLSTIPIFGVFYIFSIPFTMAGLIYLFQRDKKIENKIINFWFISSFLLLFVMSPPNINRINIVWMPLILYTIIGIYFLSDNKRDNKKIAFNTIICIYAIVFIIFEISYFNIQYRGNLFVDKKKEVIQFLQNKNKEIYMEYCFKEPYIYVMFYNKIEPTISKTYFSENGEFDNVESIGKYHFYIPDDITNDSIYVISSNSNLDIEYDSFNITEIEDFIILEPKGEIIDE